MNLPDEMALEAPFFGKNVQSMLKLGRAQGVAMAAALSQQIPIYEYSPRKIKQSITGKGAASKEQVAMMLQRLLNFKEMFWEPCWQASKQRKPSTDKKSYTGWKAFVAENPGRV